MRRNKFLIEKEALPDAEKGINEDDGGLTVTQPLRELFATVDAFIFVVDSTMNAGRGNRTFGYFFLVSICFLAASGMIFLFL